MVEYLQENKKSVLQENSEHKDLFRNLHRGLQYLDEESLKEIFDKLQEESEKGKLVRLVDFLIQLTFYICKLY